MTLSLPEQVALFGLHDTCGSAVSAHLKYALSGAIIADLLLHDRIQIQGKQIQVVDSSPLGDDVLDEALRSVRSSPDQPLKRWVRGVLAEYQKERVFERLVQGGIVERVESRASRHFPYKRYPAVDQRVEDKLRDELRDVIAGRTAADRKQRLLLSILLASDLITTFLSAEEIETYKSRLDGLTEGDPIGCCVRKAVEDDEAAASAAVICSQTNF